MIALDRIGGTQMSGIIEGAVPVMHLVMTVHVLCCNVLYILYLLMHAQSVFDAMLVRNER